MDLSLPEEIVALKATVTRLFEREVLPVMDGYEDRAEFPRPLIESLGNAGLFGAAGGDLDQLLVERVSPGAAGEGQDLGGCHVYSV